MSPVRHRRDVGADASLPLRVIHVIDSGGLYGAERMLIELAVEQQRLGQEPVVVSLASPGRGEKPLERAARARGLPVRAVRMPPRTTPRGALQLLRLLGDETADIVHTHGPRGNMLLGFLPRWLRRTAWVATVHGYGDRGGLTRTAMWHRVDRLALRRADRVVLVHRAMSAIRGLNRLHDRRWRVIDNGIPTASSGCLASSPDVVPALDDDIVRFCSRGSLVIGAAGRLARQKAFHVLLRAVRDVARDRDVVLVILGEGPKRAALESLIAEIGLTGRVLLPGYRDNAIDYLRLFHLFALSSDSEGLPLVLLEAMQAAVPIVATKVGGVPHVLDEGRGGLLVEPGDWRALADAIRRCLDDPALAAARAEHARLRQASQFASATMAFQYLELYREVATHPATRPETSLTSGRHPA